MSKKQRRNRHKDFQGVRSDKGKPKKSLIRAKMRRNDFECIYPECTCEIICLVTGREVK